MQELLGAKGHPIKNVLPECYPLLNDQSSFLLETDFWVCRLHESEESELPARATRSWVGWEMVGLEVIQDEELGFGVGRDSEDAGAGPGAQNAKRFLR